MAQPQTQPFSAPSARSVALDEFSQHCPTALSSGTDVSALEFQGKLHLALTGVLFFRNDAPVYGDLTTDVIDLDSADDRIRFSVRDMIRRARNHGYLRA